jgi:hypothetical protein
VFDHDIKRDFTAHIRNPPATDAANAPGNCTLTEGTARITIKRVSEKIIFGENVIRYCTIRLILRKEIDDAVLSIQPVKTKPEPTRSVLITITDM